jgi:hypothetical protein
MAAVQTALCAKINETPSRPEFTVGAEKETLMTMKVNGMAAPPRVLVSPGAERSEAERSEAERSAVPGETKTRPDPEVVAKAQRRKFTADYEQLAPVSEKKRNFGPRASLDRRAPRSIAKTSNQIRTPFSPQRKFQTLPGRRSEQGAKNYRATGLRVPRSSTDHRRAGLISIGPPWPTFAQVK